MSDLLTERESNWKANLCITYFQTVRFPQLQQPNSFNEILNTLNINNVTALELLFAEGALIKKLLDNYFFSNWQLKISAQIGGGFWERNQEFCQFVLGLNNIPVINVPPMPVFANTEPELARFVEGDVNGVNNNVHIINFLTRNNSQLLLLPETLMLLQGLQRQNIQPADADTKRDYKSVLHTFSFRIEQFRRANERANEIIARMNRTPAPRYEPVPVHVPVSVPESVPVSVPGPESVPVPLEPTPTRSTRSTNILQQQVPDTKKRKRGGKTIKKRRKNTKKRRKGTKKRRNSNKRK